MITPEEDEAALRRAVADVMAFDRTAPTRLCEYVARTVKDGREIRNVPVAFDEAGTPLIYEVRR